MSKKQIIWISEEQAAMLLGYKPMYFRRLVLEDRLLGISYVKLGKGYEYNKIDVEAYKLSIAKIA